MQKTVECDETALNLNDTLDLCGTQALFGHGIVYEHDKSSSCDRIVRGHSAWMEYAAYGNVPINMCTLLRMRIGCVWRCFAYTI